MLVCTLNKTMEMAKRQIRSFSAIQMQVAFFLQMCFTLEHSALLQWNSNPWTLLDIYYSKDSKQILGTTGIRTQTLLRGEKYVTDSQLLKDYIFLICLMTCSWDVLYFRSWNSRCLASVVRAAVVKSEPVIWKVIWGNLVYSTEAGKIKIPEIGYSQFFLLKTKLKRNPAPIQTKRKFWVVILRRYSNGHK